jgi:hypothetical protein
MNRKLLMVMVIGWAASTAWAGTHEWTSGWGQGVTEYLVDDGNGNALNISCPGDEDRYISAYATIAGKEYSSEDDVGFDVTIDGDHYSNPFFTDCHVCGANFPGFWSALRSANNLRISAEGKTVNLSAQNIKKTLLPLDHKENSCSSAW